MSKTLLEVLREAEQIDERKPERPVKQNEGDRASARKTRGVSPTGEKGGWIDVDGVIFNCDGVWREYYSEIRLRGYSKRVRCPVRKEAVV